MAAVWDDLDWTGTGDYEGAVPEVYRPCITDAYELMKLTALAVIAAGRARIPELGTRPATSANLYHLPTFWLCGYVDPNSNSTITAWLLAAEVTWSEYQEAATLCGFPPLEFESGVDMCVVHNIITLVQGEKAAAAAERRMVMWENVKEALVAAADATEQLYHTSKRSRDNTG